jgi:hypothetical protein
MNGRCGTCKVVNLINLGIIRRGYIVPHKLKKMAVKQMENVLFASGKIIIETNDIIPFV